jgi:hypothetical protein
MSRLLRVKSLLIIDGSRSAYTSYFVFLKIHIDVQIVGRAKTFTEVFVNN